MKVRITPEDILYCVIAKRSRHASTERYEVYAQSKKHAEDFIESLEGPFYVVLAYRSNQSQWNISDDPSYELLATGTMENNQQLFKYMVL